MTLELRNNNSEIWLTAGSKVPFFDLNEMQQPFPFKEYLTLEEDLCIYKKGMEETTYIKFTELQEPIFYAAQNNYPPVSNDNTNFELIGVYADLMGGYSGVVGYFNEQETRVIERAKSLNDFAEIHITGSIPTGMISGTDVDLGTITILNSWFGDTPTEPQTISNITLDGINYELEDTQARDDIASKQDKLTAGANITIENNVISATGGTSSPVWGNITGTLSNQTDLQGELDYINDKIRDIELFKFPNAVIIGEPTIQNGQVSNFSTVSYLQFPFILDLHNQAFQIDFCFTTATNVQTQQNILDSNFGLALAIQNGKGVMAISSNGTSWDIGSAIGSINIQANTTYYARFIWNRLQYKTQLSTDGVNYVDDMIIVDTRSPFPRTMFIGGCDQLETGHTPHPFLGSINMNKATLSVMGNVIWQGMDDAGLATRADISLSNLDSVGLAMFDKGNNAYDTIQTYGNIVTHSIDEFLSSNTTIADLTSTTQLNAINSGITDNDVSNYNSHIANTTIHVTASDKIAWSQKANISDLPTLARANVPGLVAGGNWLTVNQTTGKMECGELTKTQYDSALGYTFISKTTLENVLTGKGYITSSYHDNTKQDVISDLATIRSGAELGSTALQSITSDNVTSALGYTPYNATNPKGYITSNYHDSTKQDKLTSGVSIKTVNGNSLLGSGDLQVQGYKYILQYPQAQGYMTFSPSDEYVIGDCTEDTMTTIYSITLDQDSTISFGNPGNIIQTFELRLVMTDVYSITFPSTVKWLDGITPDLSKTGLYYLVFRYDRPSGTYLGNLQGRWSI